MQQVRFSHNRLRKVVAKSIVTDYFLLSLIPFPNLQQPCLKAGLIFGGKTRAASLTGRLAETLLKGCRFLYPAPLQLFRELSEKVHGTIPKGIVGGF